MKHRAPNDAWQPTQMDHARFERAPLPVAQRISLREILTVAFHDRRRILAALLAGLLLTTLVVLLVPKKYTAEASLLLRLGREYLVRSAQAPRPRSWLRAASRTALSTGIRAPDRAVRDRSTGPQCPPRRTE